MKPPPLPPMPDGAECERLMRLALDEARLAAERNEVPVGCIVLNERGEVTGRGGDERQRAADPLGHAEVIAIRQAAAAQGDWRLDGHTLVVTLEPCPMCAGLILMARVGRVIMGAANDKWGAGGTKLDLVGAGVFPHKAEVFGGVLPTECAAVLSAYFGGRRKAAKQRIIADEPRPQGK